VSQYQKGKTNLDYTEARDSEWQWHELGHMQVCTSLQTDNHASTPPLSFFTGRMPFQPTASKQMPNQQHQSIEGIKYIIYNKSNILIYQVTHKTTPINVTVAQKLKHGFQCHLVMLF